MRIRIDSRFLFVLFQERWMRQLESWRQVWA